MNSTLLAFNQIRFAYDQASWELTIPQLCLGREPVTCVVGPNGSGKSTLLRIAAGILAPRTGGVTLHGTALSQMHRRTIARKLAFLPQDIPALFDYSVEEITRMGRYAYGRGLGMLTEEDNHAVNQALAAVEMDSLRKRPLSRLSGGERRRAMIASVLAQAPDILLLDEPTSALDIHHAAAVMRLLSRLAGEQLSVVVVTHDINLASLFGDRLLLLVDGGIRADGPPADVVSPEIMTQAYGQDVLVRKHPETGGPMIVPRLCSVQEETQHDA